MALVWLGSFRYRYRDRYRYRQFRRQVDAFDTDSDSDCDSDRREGKQQRNSRMRYDIADPPTERANSTQTNGD